MRPESSGAPEARAIPKHNGNATKNTTTPAAKSFDNESPGEPGADGAGWEALVSDTRSNLVTAEASDKYKFPNTRFDFPEAMRRELIKKVWEADPLLCPRCQHEMRIVALIDEAAVVERILRHLGLWEAGVRVDAARDPPEPFEPVIEPWLDDPFPDYDQEPVFAGN